MVADTRRIEFRTPGRGGRGRVVGFVADVSDPVIASYLGKFTPRGVDIQSALKAVTDRIAVLEDIEVPESLRGKGLGVHLLEHFMQAADGAPILLVADAIETQSEGFDLVDWYSRRGFGEVERTMVGPVMLHDEESAMIARAALGSPAIS